jgi:signal transduction histidine kinase
MKSIRLSLMVYFLVLLAVALTVASLLVFRTAEQTLQAKRQATEQLIQAQYRERCREEEARFDDALREQAQSLARFVQVQFDSDRVETRSRYLSLHALGLLSSSLSPNGYVLAPTWIAEGAPGKRLPLEERFSPERRPPGERPPRRGPWLSRVFLEFHHKKFWDLTLREDRLLFPGDGLVCDYFQIDSPSGNPYHSPSMAGRSFALDPRVFAADRLVDWVFEDTILSPDTRVRRVVLKTSGVDVVWGGGGPRSAPPNQRPPPRSGPTIYVHCAAETGKRDANLAGLAQRRDEEMAAVDSQTNDSLGSLRTRLLAISLIVFAATAVGSFWLVRLGLSPLRRLSDAVSRVSAKDFHLPLGERSLPLELRPIADRLTNTLALLKRAFAREKQAAADISHELRTPLAALLTTTELALRKPRSVEQYRELMQDCRLSAQQMNQIVERLLTLARLDAGVDRLRPQAVDVTALARQCAAVVRPLAEARDLTLTVKCPPLEGDKETGRQGDKEKQALDAFSLSPCLPVSLSPMLVQIDPDKLREVVTNLLHNAIQYNRPGGSIGLRVARDNGSLEVQVQDTGIGIASEAREHIFERFYRADPSRGSDELHAGLGLAIVKEYIDLMGGSIGVESTEGQGSTFRVLLPVG